MYTFIIILISLICLLLTVAVLLQPGQGQGLAGGVAGNLGAGAVMGARRTADFLSKATTYLGGTFLALCLIANFFIDRGTTGRSVISGSVPAGQTQPALPQLPAADSTGN